MTPIGRKVTHLPDHLPHKLGVFGEVLSAAAVPRSAHVLGYFVASWWPTTIGQDDSRPRKKADIPPLPTELPPINNVHRDTVRGWCQLLKLSTKGQKVENYQRILQRCFPHQKDTIGEGENTRLQRKLKVDKEKKSKERNRSSEKSGPPNLAPAPEMETSVLDGTLMKVEKTIVVSTSTTEAGKSSKEAEDLKWCLVHEKCLPGNTKGWTRLQCHPGQEWVPDRLDNVIALFLTPALVCTPPHMEDNLLCPVCVQRNIVLMKSLQCE
ncbi:PREDICTED: developmental pluripotency-associated protein 4-like [Elephantulus edwardii]|uniref:developmental pluripotency-associated protein 4-like n=1 Tax=Elephantulus edwardii TaxID=28737 RepID=UPI0003F0A7E7|nr:PREDICTED: developmental pluripotency-associated protein 4-like [Elephantulus edwardii]